MKVFLDSSNTYECTESAYNARRRLKAPQESGTCEKQNWESEIVSPPPKTGTPQVHLITNTPPKHSRHMEKKNAFFVIAIKEAFQTARHTKAYKHVWVEG